MKEEAAHLKAFLASSRCVPLALNFLKTVADAGADGHILVNTFQDGIDGDMYDEAEACRDDMFNYLTRKQHLFFAVRNRLLSVGARMILLDIDERPDFNPDKYPELEIFEELKPLLEE